ncbi:hypothetical protein E1301_Tti017258 [Triplophysa tibetana]|uniref:Uncharacterized protein n=1 Tax=Triplophysa tibetana TaxID=1572043 RepID=A0A5A9N5X7_9TELE|nr:hypothetical protein E1301_Tti017258 [Triplophysa tibetana]
MGSADDQHLQNSLGIWPDSSAFVTVRDTGGWRLTGALAFWCSLLQEHSPMVNQGSLRITLHAAARFHLRAYVFLSLAFWDRKACWSLAPLALVSVLLRALGATCFKAELFVVIRRLYGLEGLGRGIRQALLQVLCGKQKMSSIVFSLVLRRSGLHRFSKMDGECVKELTPQHLLGGRPSIPPVTCDSSPRLWLFIVCFSFLLTSSLPFQQRTKLKPQVLYLHLRDSEMLNGNRDKKYSSVFVGQTRIDRYSSAVRSLTRILLRKWNSGGICASANRSYKTTRFLCLGEGQRWIK